MKTAQNKKQEIKLQLTKKEAEYLSSLVEAQVSRLITLDKKELDKKHNKEEYRVFNKLGGMLSV